MSLLPALSVTQTCGTARQGGGAVDRTDVPPKLLKGVRTAPQRPHHPGFLPLLPGFVPTSVGQCAHVRDSSHGRVAQNFNFEGETFVK